MDVSQPIRTAIPTVDGPVLHALSGTTAPLTLTRIHSLAPGVSLSGARNALQRMCRTGLVFQTPAGYLLNRDHVAAPGVIELSRARAILFSRIGQTAATWSQPPAILVGVFGSTARRDGDESSDIDLLVLTPDPITDDRIGDLAQAVELWSGNPCHIVAITATDLARMAANHEPVLTEWTRDLVPLHGNPATLETTR